MLSRLWRDEAPPQIPSDLSPELTKFFREYNDYIQRLGGLLSGYNIKEAIAQEGKFAVEWISHTLVSGDYTAGSTDWAFSETWANCAISGMRLLTCGIDDVDGAPEIFSNICSFESNYPNTLLQYNGSAISIYHDVGAGCLWDVGDIIRITIVYERDQNE